MIGDKIRAVLKAAKETQYTASEKLGISQGCLNLWINNKRIPSVTDILKISEVFKIRPSFFLDEEDVASIPVVGYVQAGAFQEAAQWDKGNFYTVNPPVMPEYRDNNLFALEVRGDSMDKVYPEGTCIICVPVAEVGLPTSGKRVVCARNLPDGTVEATVKEYRVTPSGTYLIPHSTNPVYLPYRLDDGLYGNCEIVAIVVGSFRKE